MLQKLLRLIRKLIDFILDDSPEEKVSKQIIIAVEGDVNITVTGDNNFTSNLILPKEKATVKQKNVSKNISDSATDRECMEK